MASADELRRFATAKFLSNGIGSRTGAWDRDVWIDYRDLPDDDFIRISDFAIRPAGELVEREGWHTLGARLGYLNEREPLPDDDRRVLEKVLSLPATLLWPRWFRSFAGSLLQEQGRDGLWPDVFAIDTERVAVFQAAMVTAEELADPLIADLQWALQSDFSVLDGGQQNPDIGEVFERFESRSGEDDPLQIVQSLPQCVAGFFKLIEVMASFDNLFIDMIETPFTKVRRGDGFNIAQQTANLVTWRFNLRDERTVARLRVVMDAFWHVCDSQLSRYLEPGVTWSSTNAHKALLDMLARWRDRAEPEPGVKIPRLVGSPMDEGRIRLPEEAVEEEGPEGGGEEGFEG